MIGRDRIGVAADDLLPPSLTLGTLIAPMFGVVGDRIGHRDLTRHDASRPMRYWPPR